MQGSKEMGKQPAGVEGGLRKLSPGRRSRKHQSRGATWLGMGGKKCSSNIFAR